MSRIICSYRFLGQLAISTYESLFKIILLCKVFCVMQLRLCIFYVVTNLLCISMSHSHAALSLLFWWLVYFTHTLLFISGAWFHPEQLDPRGM